MHCVESRDYMQWPFLGEILKYIPLCRTWLSNLRLVAYNYRKGGYHGKCRLDPPWDSGVYQVLLKE